MMDDNYDQGSGAATIPPAAAQDDSKGEQSSDQQTYLVNKEICPGMKVGDKLTGRVVAIHDNEYECVYEKDDEGAEPKAMAQAPPMGGQEGGGNYA